MSFELVGKLIEKYEEVQVNDRFKKREFVVETVENNGFTEQIKFQLVQDKTNVVDSYGIGDQVKVSFNIKGNKWKDNYFVNLNAWRVENAGSANATSGADFGTPPPSIDDVPPVGDDPNDDLPF